MSLLTIVTAFCQRTNLPVPVAVMASVDPQIVQVRALLEEEGDDLSKRGMWQNLVREQTLTTLAAENQGSFSGLTTLSSRSIVNQTIWSRTSNLPVAGPLDAREWQALKAFAGTGPYYQYRIRSGDLLINPIPPAGESWAFEYVTDAWITSSDGLTYKRAFTDDSDLLLLPESLAVMGLRWRWKKEKGLEYAEDLRTYEMQVKDALGRDGGKDVLHMDRAGQDARPGIFVSQGSWVIP